MTQLEQAKNQITKESTENGQNAKQENDVFDKPSTEEALVENSTVIAQRFSPTLRQVCPFSVDRKIQYLQ